jgi:hypothetical protein
MRIVLFLAAAQLFVGATRAATITYSFDSAQSRLSASGSVRNITMSPQETGSMSGAFGGTLQAQWRDDGLTLSGGSSIVSLPNPAGPFVPSAADVGSGSMVDNFGVEGRVLGDRVLSAALRDAVADIYGPVDYGGPVTSLRFGFAGGTVDYEDHTSGELGFNNLNGLEPVLNTANGSLTRTVQNNLDTITLPIFVNLPFDVFEPKDSRLRLEGQLVATAPVLTLEPNETLAISSPQHLAELRMLETGATVRLASSTLVTGLLDIKGETSNSTLDLSTVTSTVVIDYPAAGPDPAKEVHQQIVAGRGGTQLIGKWDGPGITSSLAAKRGSSLSIGWGVNEELPFGPYTTFRGEPVDPSTVLIRVTLIGDANLDGVVDDDDVTILGAMFGAEEATWAMGDFDYNSAVDDDDVTLMGAFYSPGAPPVGGPLAAPPGASPIAAVPEPASWLLMTLAGLTAGLLVRLRTV